MKQEFFLLCVHDVDVVFFGTFKFINMGLRFSNEFIQCRRDKIIALE